MSHYHDISVLRKAGYKITEKSPWHFQIKQGKALVNIWPTKQKFMREYGNGASFYDDVVQAVESIVGKPGVKQPSTYLVDKYVRERQETTDPFAWDEWQQGLMRIRAKIKG